MKPLVSIVLLLIMITPARAHEVEAGPHGGPLTDLGMHHLELVLSATGVWLYVSDAAQEPIALKGASGQAVILAGRKQIRLDLAPHGAALSAAADIPSTGPYRIVVTANLGGQKPLQARFELAKLIAHAHETDADHGQHGHHQAERHDHGDGNTKAATIMTARVDGDFKAGATLPVTLTVTDKATGRPLGPDAFKIAHTRPVHLLIVDPSLGDYHHIHPMPGPKPGEWVFEITPAHDRRYRIWADVVRSDTGTQDYITVDLNPDGAVGPAPAQTTIMSASSAGLDWTMTLDKPLKVGRASRAEIMISKEGKPFQALEPVMGAFAHMVGFSEDYQTILHVHPTGREPEQDDERGGPSLTFHVEPQKAGLVRFWAQVEVEDSQVFVPFTAIVKAGS